MARESEMTPKNREPQRIHNKHRRSSKPNANIFAYLDSGLLKEMCTRQKVYYPKNFVEERCPRKGI
jgi:hypothetical protein